MSCMCPLPPNQKPCGMLTVLHQESCKMGRKQDDKLQEERWEPVVPMTRPRALPFPLFLLQGSFMAEETAELRPIAKDLVSHWSRCVRGQGEVKKTQSVTP